MVINQFNKLIRNKWVWGVFAILISLAFVAPDEWFRGDDRRGASDDGRNKLANAELDPVLYGKCENLVRDFMPMFQRSPVAHCFSRNSVRDYWKAYAAIVTARKAGFTVSDADLAERIKAMFPGDGGFSEAQYAEDVRRAFGIGTTVFEEQLRLWMTLERVLDGAVASASWTPATEIDQTGRDYTDRLTVQVATFTEDKAEADAVKVDEAGLRKWFDEHKDELALPERYMLKTVKFDPDASNVVAKVEVSEDDVKARYEENSEKGMYDVPPATTNDVKTVKPLEDVREGIVTALRHEAGLELLKKELRERSAVDEDDEDAAAGLLAGVAAAEGLQVETTPWFALGGRHVEGFMQYVSTVFPGVNRRDFDRVVRSLADYRFGVVASDRNVWLVELAETSPAHTPDFDEAKDHIGDDALRDAKLDAFREKVEAVAAKGAEAVLASGSVSTNLTFAACDFGRDYAFGWMNMYNEWDFKNAGFPNAEKVVFAARSLRKGEVSKFVSVGSGKGILVVCNDRRDGDPADLMRGDRFARSVAARSQATGTMSGWLDWNLARLGYRETPAARQDDAEDDE